MYFVIHIPELDTDHPPHPSSMDEHTGFPNPLWAVTVQGRTAGLSSQHSRRSCRQTVC